MALAGFAVGYFVAGTFVTANSPAVVGLFFSPRTRRERWFLCRRNALCRTPDRTGNCTSKLHTLRSMRPRVSACLRVCVDGVDVHTYIVARATLFGWLHPSGKRERRERRLEGRRLKLRDRILSVSAARRSFASPTHLRTHPLTLTRQHAHIRTRRARATANCVD